MHLSQMPLFDVFLPVIQENTIKRWSSNDFWLQIKLSEKERNRFNRQRMYRILRKLVELGFLEKKVNYSNHRFSRFYETEKTIELKHFSKSKIDLSNMVLEENKIHDEITFLEKQTDENKEAVYYVDFVAKGTNSFGGIIQSKYSATVLNDENLTVLSISKND